MLGISPAAEGRNIDFDWTGLYVSPVFVLQSVDQCAADGLVVSSYDLRLIEILGEAKYYLGKNNGALEQFQRYVANAPESGSRVGAAYYFMGEIYIRQARYQHADISLSAAVKKEPLLDRWWTRLGYAREMAGNYYEVQEIPVDCT